MSKPSRKNTRTFYLEDAVDAAISAAARDHGGNRSAYIKRLVLRDLRKRFSPESLERIGDAHRGKLVTDEVRGRLSESHGGSAYGVGVYRHQLCNKFVARGTIGGKHTYIGLFDTPEEARAARRIKLEEYYESRKCPNNN